MHASIITIGDEILIGQIVDTNSAWMAQKLNEVGISVAEIRSVGDDKDQIICAIQELLKSTDYIFMTGGLGPTNDDITKKVLCEMLNCDLVLNQDALANVKELLGRRGIDINENNHNQAMVPHKAEVFVNILGTAPGMMFRFDKKLLFSMPGVPFEMQHLMTNHFIPQIKNSSVPQKIFHKTILTTGLPEAILAEKLSNWENSLPEDIKLAYLPSPGYIRLRLSLYDASDDLLKTLEHKVVELKSIIPNNFINDQNLNPDQLVAELLAKLNKTLSTAESCTGGKIASIITSRPGSSSIFKGSVVAYDNDVKIDVLGVDSVLVEKYGAVSSQVVEQMASGVRRLLKTDYALATSGIAGPDGGTPEKPVGTAWIALATPIKVVSRKLLLFKQREFNIIGASNAAILMLVDELRSSSLD
ncbi:MAG: CinA family nicotinamide mononucleotide deamidase-related protein [Bacteroidales bacterium]|nr:CinA family nicotinamide mononucleotide deamidase-related protein [Bacteroidales bacterium]